MVLISRRDHAGSKHENLGFKAVYYAADLHVEVAQNDLLY